MSKPASLSLLNSTEMATHPSPWEANLFDSCSGHSQDNFEERSVKGSSLLGRAAPILLSWQVFSTSFICMETGVALGSQAAAHVYYPQIKYPNSPQSLCPGDIWQHQTRGLQGVGASLCVFNKRLDRTCLETSISAKAIEGQRDIAFAELFHFPLAE